MNSARVTPPHLNDPSQFTRMPRVPVFSSHVRKIRDRETSEIRITNVDDDQLEVICDNTNKRVKDGEFPLITIGHRDFSKKETEQPAPIGFLGSHEIGEYNGKKVILAEMFIKNEFKDEFLTYPRRSSEVFAKESPNGYIDSVAVLRRIPELDLGYITTFEKNGIESFECMCDKEDHDMDEETSNDSSIDTLPNPEDDNSNADPDTGGSDEDIDNDGDVDSVDQLGKVIAQQVAESLASNVEFYGRVGESVAAKITDNPAYLDKMIERIGNLLNKKPIDNNSNNRSSIGGNPNMGTENFEADTTVDNPAVNPNVTIGLLKVQNEELKTQVSALTETVKNLENFNKQVIEENRVTKRRSRLQSLANDGIQINVAEKLEQFSKLDDDTFEMFASEMQSSFQRIPLNNKPIQTSHIEGQPQKAADTSLTNELTIEEMNDGAVENFSKSEGLEIITPEDGLKAVKNYFAKADRSKYIKK